MKWLIEKGMFVDTEDKLIQTLKDKNIEVKTLSYVPFDEEVADRANKLYPNQTDVVFYGSLNFATKLRNLGWKGLFASYEKYDCLSYYPVFKEELLNYDYIMMPFGDIANREEFIFNSFNDNVVFIRPNSVLKEFTGQPVSQYNLEPALELMGFYDTPANSLAVIASAKEVMKEWRFVVCRGEIVTGSIYHDRNQGEQVLNLPCTDDFALEYAKRMAKLYSPEDMWILDICQQKNGQYNVLEIGCLSFAGLYGCELDKIIDKLEEIYEVCEQ
jgi:hypothetical protein